MSDVNGLSQIHQSEVPLILRENCNRELKYPSDYEDIRVMNKRGKINVHLCKVPEKSFRYVSDIWNTLVNMRWRWLLLVIALINVSAYLIFAVLFLLDAWVSGDFDDPIGNRTCLEGMHNFTSYFMLGLETITTTGYGYFHPTEYCRLIFVILTCSTMTTFFIDGAFVSVVYAKFGRSSYNWAVFSKKAVIHLRNGKLCLIVRMNDNLRKHWIDNQVNMFLIKFNLTEENEVVFNSLCELEVNPYGMIFWPVEVVHEITPESGLWNVSAKDLLTTNLEIVTVIQGSSIQTGQLTRTQTSYTSKEILWGYKFSPCLEYNAAKREYVINRKAFNATELSDTPLCSASTLHKLQTEIQLNHRRKSLGDYQRKVEDNIT